MTSQFSKLALDSLSFPAIFWDPTSPRSACLQCGGKDVVSTSSTLMIKMLEDQRWCRSSLTMSSVSKVARPPNDPQGENEA